MRIMMLSCFLIKKFPLRSTLYALRFPCALVLLCSCAFLFSGCSFVKKVQHMPQLLTLKRYSESQDKIAKEMEEQNRLFDEMAAEIEQGTFSYQTARQVRRRFKDPVFRREAEYHGQMLEQWLYRHGKDFSGDKVYFYFDGKGNLAGRDYVKETTEEQDGCVQDRCGDATPGPEGKGLGL